MQLAALLPSEICASPPRPCLRDLPTVTPIPRIELYHSKPTFIPIYLSKKKASIRMIEKSNPQHQQTASHMEHIGMLVATLHVAEESTARPSDPGSALEERAVQRCADNSTAAKSNATLWCCRGEQPLCLLLSRGAAKWGYCKVLLPQRSAHCGFIEGKMAAP